MSLADELLADLEEGGEEEEDMEQIGQAQPDDVAEMDVVTLTEHQTNSIHSIAKLRDGPHVSIKTRFSICFRYYVALRN